MAPPWGSQRREPQKDKMEKKQKMCKVVKQTFRARIWLIFCMRGSYIHFRWFPHAPGSPRPLKRPKNIILLFAFLFLSFLFFSFWGVFGGLWGVSRRGHHSPSGLVEDLQEPLEPRASELLAAVAGAGG